MMEAAINKQGLNYNLMPFGRLKRETLIEARKILVEIGWVLLVSEILHFFISTYNRIGMQILQRHNNIEDVGKLIRNKYTYVLRVGVKRDV